MRGAFNRKGLKLKLDPANAVRSTVDEILAQALVRTRDPAGKLTLRAVLLHLVGAKLALVFGDDLVKHKPATESDESGGAPGDFVIAETVVHVTTAPSPALIEKCGANVRKGLRPIIVCPQGMTSTAQQLARAVEFGLRIDVYDAQQFISTNLNVKAGFKASGLKETTYAFIQKYNEIVSNVERDPSLMIEAG